MGKDHYPCLSTWQVEAEAKTTVIPQNHWLLLRHNGPFRWDLSLSEGEQDNELHGESFALNDEQHLALIQPGLGGDATLSLHCKQTAQTITGSFLFTGEGGAPSQSDKQASKDLKKGMALLTNGRGGMARLAVDLGSVYSKYDAALAVNLHPEWPVDRHVLLKRIRVWADADGFFSPLNKRSLVHFHQDKDSAHWHFRVACGNKEPSGCASSGMDARASQLPAHQMVARRRE